MLFLLHTDESWGSKLGLKHFAVLCIDLMRAHPECGATSAKLTIYDSYPHDPENPDRHGDGVIKERWKEQVAIAKRLLGDAAERTKLFVASVNEQASGMNDCGVHAIM